MVREVLDNPWVDHVWKANGIALEFPPDLKWKKLTVTQGNAHYIVSAELQLHRGETVAYFANINDNEPSVYIVLRELDEGEEEDVPLHVHLVTVSPYEAADYLDSGEDIVERIPMPEALIDEVKRFTAEHHYEEKFRKRKRDKLDIEEHKFGQEPIFMTKQRSNGSSPDDDKKN